MMAVGLVLTLIGLFLGLVCGWGTQEGWRQNVSTSIFCFGPLLMLASLTAWLWRVLP